MTVTENLAELATKINTIDIVVVAPRKLGLFGQH